MPKFVKLDVFYVNVNLITNFTVNGDWLIIYSADGSGDLKLQDPDGQLFQKLLTVIEMVGDPE